MNSTRGASLSINVIIIAILALLVLVVLAFIFGSRMGWFGDVTNDCASVGGTCQPSCPEGYAQLANKKCEQEGKVCCIPATGS